VWEALEAMPHLSPPLSPAARKCAVWQATEEGEASTSSQHPTPATTASQACSPRSHSSTHSQPETGAHAAESLAEAVSDALTTRDFGDTASMGCETSVGSSTMHADVVTAPGRPTCDDSYVGLFLRTCRNSETLDVGNPSVWDRPRASEQGTPSSTQIHRPETPEVPHGQVLSSEYETSLAAHLDDLQRGLRESFPSSASPGGVGRSRRRRSQVRNVQSSPLGRDTSPRAHARQWSTSLRSDSAQRQRSATQATPPPGSRMRRSNREVDEEIGDQGLRDYVLALLRAVEEAPALHASADTPDARQLPQQCEVEATMRSLDSFTASENLPDACVICLEDMRPSQRIARLPCRHCFHLTCIQCWLPASLTCPLCKQPAARL
jgi:hypothetical protein